MNWLLTNTITAIVLPPTSLLLLLIAGLLLQHKNRRWSTFMLVSGIIAFWLVSTPLISRALLQSLERNVAPVNVENKAQAIVVLGAGRRLNALEYGGGDTISAAALERVRYAAFLAHKTGVPLLTSGGDPEAANAPANLAEGAMMKSVLEAEFNTPVRWVETRSSNSADEASACWSILSPQHIHKIYLVTHAWHMRRAEAAFKNAGFEVVAAPTGFTREASIPLLLLIPNSRALEMSRIALHEWAGLLWYGLSGKT